MNLSAIPMNLDAHRVLSDCILELESLTGEDAVRQLAGAIRDNVKLAEQLLADVPVISPWRYHYPPPAYSPRPGEVIFGARAPIPTRLQRFDIYGRLAATVRRPGVIECGLVPEPPGWYWGISSPDGVSHEWGIVGTPEEAAQQVDRRMFALGWVKVGRENVDPTALERRT